MEAASVTFGSPEYLALARRARLLSWASLGYMALAVQEGREAWRGGGCC